MFACVVLRLESTTHGVVVAALNLLSCRMKRERSSEIKPIVQDHVRLRYWNFYFQKLSNALFPHISPLFIRISQSQRSSSIPA